MAGSTKKTAAKKVVAPKKTPVAEAVDAAVEEVGEQAAPAMVTPMHPDAYRLAMAIVNRADVKGGDAETIVLLKRELARVSGNLSGPQRA